MLFISRHTAVECVQGGLHFHFFRIRISLFFVEVHSSPREEGASENVR